MGISQELINFNEMFYQLKEEPIIVNDLSNSTEEERKYVEDLITTRYSSDMLSVLPSCQCGQTKGEYERGNVVCEYCKTPVRSQIEEDIEPIVWFRRPIGVAPLLNPVVYTMLNDRFRKSGFNIIDWLTDTTYNSDKKQPPVLDTILGAGVQRGYNYFVENFDKVMDVLFSQKIFKLKKGERDYLWDLITIHRDKLFSDYIPLPNKALLVIESNNLGTFVDNVVVDAKDVIMMITSIDRKFANHHVRLRENRTAKAISRLSEVYENYISKNMSPKTGLLRKHIFASRSHFSGRAVITSLTDAHEYDEIFIPWGLAITTLRNHLLSKMVRLGYALNTAIALLNGHVHKYNPFIDGLFKELIAESSEAGIPALIHRN